MAKKSAVKKPSSTTAKKAAGGTVTIHYKNSEGETKETYKVPKALGRLADHAYTLDRKRLELQRQAEVLSTEIKAIQQYLEEKQKKEALTGIQGRKGLLELQPKSTPTIEDDKKFFAFIKRTSRFEFLQRRLNTSAVAEVWEHGKDVPGVGRWDYLRLSIRSSSAKK